MSDYSDDFIEYRVREQLDPSLDFAVRFIMDSDMTDLRYLYQYGAPPPAPAPPYKEEFGDVEGTGTFTLVLRQKIDIIASVAVE